jgi:hypothetical protein
VADPSLPYRADRERVRQQQRTLHGSELHELGEPRRLAVAVHDVAAAEHLLGVEVAAVGQDRRDPGAQALALDEG